ncbi:MAG: hypothetical protein ACK4PI_01005 [Tepidisphaerales bacterium]
MGTIGSCLVGVWLSLSGSAADHTPDRPSAPSLTPPTECRSDGSAPASLEPGAFSDFGQPDAFRLRRMHLVRPDLIPYPTFRSVYA